MRTENAILRGEEPRPQPEGVVRRLNLPERLILEEMRKDPGRVYLAVDLRHVVRAGRPDDRAAYAAAYRVLNTFLRQGVVVLVPGADGLPRVRLVGAYR